jgi:hypothetical protein
MNFEDKIDVCYEISKMDIGQHFLQILSDFCLENAPLKGSDVHDTYYNLGKRDVILYIRNLIKQKVEAD